MKKYCYCAEEIQNEAIKCRYCGEFLEKKAQEKWCFKTHIIVVAFLCVGPLALPLVWLNPRYSKTVKIVVSSIVLILSYYLIVMFVKSINSIKTYYELLS